MMEAGAWGRGASSSHGGQEADRVQQEGVSDLLPPSSSFFLKFLEVPKIVPPERDQPFSA
jgi:hypothetical protein